MGKKVNPLGFRAGITKDYNSIWFADSRNYKARLEDHHFLRKEILSEFQKIPRFRVKRISNIESISPTKVLWKGAAEKPVQYTLIRIHTCGAICFKAAKAQFSNARQVKDFCSLIRKKFLRFKASQSKKSLPKTKFGSESRVLIYFYQHPTGWNARLLANTIASSLEARKNFRRVMKREIRMLYASARSSSIEGVKIQISGRLNGAEIARSEWIRKGCIPLHTLYANIDYYAHEAHTIYGILGIKVWIYKRGLTSFARKNPKFKKQILIAKVNKNI